MGAPRKYDYPAPDEIAEGVARCGSYTAYAKEVGIPADTLRHHVQADAGLYQKCREAIAVGGATPAGDQPAAARDPGPSSTRTSVSSDDPTEWGDIEALLKARGLDPDDWVVIRLRVNEWGENAEGEPLRQLRVDLEPRSPLALTAARSDGWRPPARTTRKTKPGAAELVAFFGDHHCPNQDPDLHIATCEWLRNNKPSRGVLLGDLLDEETVSRHRAQPQRDEDMNSGVQAGYDVLRAYVEASPDTEWILVPGNHDWRLHYFLIEQARALYGLTRAHRPEDEKPEDPVLSLVHLLRLDELGIELIDPGDDYKFGQYKVSPFLAARHGWIARKGSGASAVSTLDHLRYSVVIGHCHRQAIVFHSQEDIDGEPQTLVACEAGTMAVTKGGLGYSVAPNWQRGFATASIWPDGRFKLDLAQWVDGSLIWSDQRYDQTPAPTLAAVA